MSIRWYSTTGELTGAGPKSYKCARFELLLAHRNSAGAKPKYRRCEYSVVADTDANVEAHGVTLAEKILAMTGSAAMKFSKILGHQRKDEVIPIVAVNKRIWAIKAHSPLADSITHVPSKNLKVFIPNFNGSVGQLNELLDLAASGASLGYIRWADVEQGTLEAMPAVVNRGQTIKDETAMTSEELVSDNAGNGVADGVLDAEE